MTRAEVETLLGKANTETWTQVESERGTFTLGEGYSVNTYREADATLEILYQDDIVVRLTVSSCTSELTNTWGITEGLFLGAEQKAVEELYGEGKIIFSGGDSGEPLTEGITMLSYYRSADGTPLDSWHDGGSSLLIGIAKRDEGSHVYIMQISSLPPNIDLYTTPVAETSMD